MTNSLRDQLLGLGFKPAPKPDRPKPAPRDRRPPPSGAQASVPKPSSPATARPPGKKGGRGEMDLAKAYAIRAQQEKQERIEAERLRQVEAQKRREGKLKLAELLKRASLNDAAAEIARHFEYGGKIRRIYVTADQLKAVNAGTLAVVQLAGRYHVVSVEDGLAAEELLPGALALRVDPAAPVSDDPYADPRYQVPDDLVW